MIISRRSVLKMGTAATALFAMSAASANANAPAYGGTLRASMDLQPISLDPIFGNGFAVDRMLFNQLFDALLRLETDGSLSPALADSWAYSEDNLTLTVKLREGVSFHDGTPFDADAAAYNLLRAIDPQLNAPHTKDLENVSAVTTTGPMTIEIHLSEPSGAFLSVLATEAAMMSSPRAIEEKGEGYGRAPVGTGPFKFVRWLPDEYVEAERNEQYWRTGADGAKLPYVDSLRMRFNSNNATKIIEVKGRNLDLADAITPSDAIALADDTSVQLLDVPGGILSWINFNNEMPPFDNINIRKAVVAAIDRNGLLNATSSGVGAVVPSFFAPNEWVYSASPDQHGYDPDYARQLVAESGLGPVVTATLSVIQRDPDAQVAQLVQAQLSQVGINLTIEVLDRTAWVQKVLEAKHQLGIGRSPVPYPDPDQAVYSRFGPNAAYNWANIHDEKLADIVTRARQSTDTEERKALYNEMQAHVIDNAYYVFLFMRGVRHISSPKLQGVQFEPSGSWYLDEAYFG